MKEARPTVTHIMREPPHAQYLPSRLTADQNAIHQLSESKRQALMGMGGAATVNAQEFMEAIFVTFAPENKTLKAYFNNNTLLPSPELLTHTLKPLLEEKGHHALYDRLENVVIDNRLRIIAGLQQRMDEGQDTRCSIGKSVQLLPLAYWKAALEKANNPDEWARKETLPTWAYLMPVIDCKAEYLRAARHVAQMDAYQVGIKTGMKHTTVNAIETGQRIDAPRLQEECLKLGALYSSKTDLFKQSVLDALPMPEETPNRRRAASRTR